MGYIDMHCDTLMVGLSQKKNTIQKLNNSQIDFSKLKNSPCKAQMFAAFLPQSEMEEWFGYDYHPDLFDLFHDMRDLLLRSIEEDKEHFALVETFDDIRANEEAGKISCILTIENGALVNNDMEMLKKLADLDVKVMALTWNDPNCFGQCNSEDRELMKLPLTEFGREAIPVMNELGIVVDVSHLNEGGFYGVAECSKKPFIATHSNAFALSPSPRNLTDDQIRTLADKGGISGLNFYGGFLNEDIDNEISTVERLCDHAMYMMNKGGEDFIAMGTDFDGEIADLEIPSCDHMEVLFDALQQRGMTARQFGKFTHENVERVLKECWVNGGADD